MASRASIPADVVAEVVVGSRRRCAVCFGLNGDSAEKRGQVAHLDQDSSNSARANLVFLCLEHHDVYDSRTSQSKNLTVEEVRRYRGQLERFVQQSLPLSDQDIARALIASLDRPAFRTPFQHESSLPRFKNAIEETIAVINTGKQEVGRVVPGKAAIGESSLRAKLDAIVTRLVTLRAAFDDLLRSGDIRPCGCKDPECPTHMFSHRAVRDMDRHREDVLVLAQELHPEFPGHFYNLP